MSKLKLFTEAQAAKEMTISAATLYRRRKDNQVRHYRKIGRLIRYTEEDIRLNLEDLKAFRPSVVSQRPVTEARFG
jgi:predicted DNA-binding transcriptional regulator AlpA